MGSTFMFSVRICQKPLKAWFHRGPYVFTSNTPKCKRQTSLPARFMCTERIVSIPHGRPQGNSAQGGAKRSNIRQTPAFPKSVFAAGTARRTAEMLRRKSALRSQDGDEVDVEESRGLSARESGKGEARTFSQVCG